jgi:integrase/recombinase XerD
MKFFPDPHPVPPVELIDPAAEEHEQVAADQEGATILPIDQGRDRRTRRGRSDKTKQAEATTVAIDVRLPIINEFLNTGSLEANSRRAYERALRRFIEWSEVLFAEVKPNQLAQYRDWLESSPSPKTGKPMARNSVNLEIAAIKRFFGWLSETYPRHCPTNPAAKLKQHKVTSTTPDDLSQEAVGWIVKTLPHLKTEVRDRVLLHLLMHGLRASEVAGLSVASIDRDNLFIAKTKTHSSRVVPLIPVTVQAIEQYLNWRRDQLGEVLAPDSPLIISMNYAKAKKGKRLSYDGIYQAIEKIGAMARRLALISWLEAQKQKLVAEFGEFDEFDEFDENGDRVPLGLESVPPSMLPSWWSEAETLIEAFKRGRWNQAAAEAILPQLPSELRQLMQELEGIHPHQSRHTYATQLLFSGLDPAHARKLTGHQSQQVFKRYTERAEQDAAIAAFRRLGQSQNQLEEMLRNGN